MGTGSDEAQHEKAVSGNNSRKRPKANRDGRMGGLSFSFSDQKSRNPRGTSALLIDWAFDTAPLRFELLSASQNS